jgi:ribose 5-phosphate isomerase
MSLEGTPFVIEGAATSWYSMLSHDIPDEIDLTIDGANVVDPVVGPIKGGGGALLREKIVARASRREVIVVDDSKLSPKLGRNRALPVGGVHVPLALAGALP